MWVAKPRAESIGSSGSSLLCKNFKLLCKFHLPPVAVACYSRLRVRRLGRGGGVAINREPAAGSRLSAVWREQKRQANAIIQVAAVISCLISIINTRHRHGRQIPASIPRSPSPSSLCPSVQSNNGHKSFHMPSVWSAAGAPSILTHSGQRISTRNAIFYFRADFDSFFFLG